MKQKTSIGIAVGITAVLAIAVFLVGMYYSNKIKKEISANIQSYEKIDVDLLQQKIHVKGLEYRQGKTMLKASEVSLVGLHYWAYIMKDRLIINKVEVHSPQLTLISSKEKRKDSSKTFKREILVRNFQAINGSFRLKKKDSVGNEIFIRFPELGISEVRIDSSTTGKTLPFNFSSYHVKGDSVAVNMNPQHFIAAEGFSIENGKASVENFRIIPYEERGAFDQSIPYEKDRISLRVDSIRLDSLSFSFKNDSLHLKNPVTIVKGADLDIYRNKLLPDDPRTKTLLSQKMRNSPVKFDFEKIKVEKSKIRYDEKVKKNTPPATVTFSQINGTVENFINTGLNRKNFPRTKIKANALFMDTSSISMEWSFNATNKNDKFLISGNFGTIAGSTLNPLLKPTLGIEAEGELQSVSFTFTGNDDAAVGEVRVIYDRFKLNIMKDEGQKKNKLLSALANLFVDNDGLSEQRTHSVEFTRDKIKSFWNFVWIGLKKGVIDALGQL